MLILPTRRLLWRELVSSNGLVRPSVQLLASVFSLSEPVVRRGPGVLDLELFHVIIAVEVHLLLLLLLQQGVLGVLRLDLLLFLQPLASILNLGFDLVQLRLLLILLLLAPLLEVGLSLLGLLDVGLGIALTGLQPQTEVQVIARVSLFAVSRGGCFEVELLSAWLGSRHSFGRLLAEPDVVALLPSLRRLLQLLVLSADPLLELLLLNQQLLDHLTQLVDLLVLLLVLLRRVGIGRVLSFEVEVLSGWLRDYLGLHLTLRYLRLLVEEAHQVFLLRWHLLLWGAADVPNG